ncbi:MAG: hypothetical protein CO144_01535 [Candidatus Nealsonbacteria bacterium CG_4_9_14_3_um_filter_35_11]|uniref:Metallopeptidase family protein n=2 Tax=Candidatus Nealsoniibacteriota TaxID=1817911 RepID=A0A2M7DAL1_9BACT|nr:MAG: hypothetical protein COV62_00335 [Candidatus Nealsonbacteria bacterium CG11_big_fil_rev_8_21_14_0_20_35_11]PIV45499.1 MAG: hypothetical protein COS24_01915 [Candidatus Nealsonbacteria bacterium CG02_land_8_20_14_3_00_34_20]PIW92624.1 MAG: hypothetical protein COZ88_01190 [Candidatus Nealsonbacteria bacterium CG_4_8_14_3_um_filter_34_13]PIZ90094.1 MAG: hypothetical protein COX88_00315 [Candidatus Nealsonbacteria bacterium CG_4_10_14_0_2_um_filter_35_20]PJA84483.1 MAG: hypothetical protei
MAFCQNRILTMTYSEFEKLVKKAVYSLPKNIQEKMKNIAIVIEDESSGRSFKKGTRIQNNLLGLYQGIPKNVWGRGFGGNLPDKITIFKEPIEKLGRIPSNIRELVKIVVWHEVAHHFGFNEAQIRRLEQKWQKSQ